MNNLIFYYIKWIYQLNFLWKKIRDLNSINKINWKPKRTSIYVFSCVFRFCDTSLYYLVEILQESKFQWMIHRSFGFISEIKSIWSSKHTHQKRLKISFFFIIKLSLLSSSVLFLSRCEKKNIFKCVRTHSNVWHNNLFTVGSTAWTNTFMIMTFPYHYSRNWVYLSLPLSIYLPVVFFLCTAFCFYIVCETTCIVRFQFILCCCCF